MSFNNDGKKKNLATVAPQKDKLDELKQLQKARKKVPPNCVSVQGLTAASQLVAAAAAGTTVAAHVTVPGEAEPLLVAGDAASFPAGTGVTSVGRADAKDYGTGNPGIVGGHINITRTS